jgi:hypothetical protein
MGKENRLFMVPSLNQKIPKRIDPKAQRPDGLFRMPYSLMISQKVTNRWLRKKLSRQGGTRRVKTEG